MKAYDVIVVGGGVVGPAIAYGLGRLGARAALLDEGDFALRAARANFGLVWVQGKGLGMQRYVQWTIESAQLWGAFAGELRDATGIGLGLHQPGGLVLCLSEGELEQRRGHIRALTEQAGPEGYACDFLDRDAAQELIPDLRLGEAVVGASFCPHDGVVNPLNLMHALHVGVRAVGSEYLPGKRVERISRNGAGFTVETATEQFRAGKVVLAAGHGSRELAPQVGLEAPIRPERGQLIITERCRHALNIPISGIGQTDDGTMMLGVTNEDVGFNERTTLDGARRMAARAVTAFPALAPLRMVRTWAGLRVLTPDKHPVYDESATHPGAFIATSHSGVTLAAVNARRVARWVAEGEVPAGFETFSARRFHAGAASSQGV